MVYQSLKIKNVFTRKGNNTSDLNAGSILSIEYIEEAEKSDYLPHNALNITNLNSNCTIFIYLDDISDIDSPDYVLFPKQTISLGIDDGASFRTLFLKNSDTVNNISAKEIKHKISTIMEIIN